MINVNSYKAMAEKAAINELWSTIDVLAGEMKAAAEERNNGRIFDLCKAIEEIRIEITKREEVYNGLCFNFGFTK